MGTTKKQIVLKNIDEQMKLAYEFKCNNKNISFTEIANKFNVDRKKLSNVYKYGYEELNGKYIIKNESYDIVKEAVDYYKNKSDCTFAEIKNIYNFKSEIFNKYLVLFNIEKHDTRIRFNRNKFDQINDEETAYWLGFILADGCIFRNELRIKLSINDINHLNKFTKIMDGENTIKISEETHSITGNKLCKISLTDKQMREKLQSYNINYNKTTKEIPYYGIEEELKMYYIRGILDGDGWINYDKHRCGFCGSNEVMTFIRDHLVKKLNITNITVSYDKSSHIYRLVWGKYEDIKKIAIYLYKDSSDLCRLDRKYEIAKKFF